MKNKFVCLLTSDLHDSQPKVWDVSLCFHAVKHWKVVVFFPFGFNLALWVTSFLVAASVGSSWEWRPWTSSCEHSGAAAAPDSWASWNGTVNSSRCVFSNVKCCLGKWQNQVTNLTENVKKGREWQFIIYL